MSEWEMQFGSLNEYLESNCKRFSLLRGRYRKPILAGIISDWPEGIKKTGKLLVEFCTNGV